VSDGDNCWLKTRGSGERRSVTGDNMMMLMIVIISPKSDTVNLYVKKKEE